MNEPSKKNALVSNKMFFLNIILISIFSTYISWIIPFLQSKDVYTLDIGKSVLLPIFIANFIVTYILFKKFLQKFNKFSKNYQFVNVSLLFFSAVLMFITIFLIINYFRLMKIPLSDKLIIESELFVFQNKFFIIFGILISTMIFVLINSYKLSKSSRIIIKKSLISSISIIFVILSIIAISSILSLLVGILIIAFTQGIQIG